MANYKVPKAKVGARLDLFLTTRLPQLSRAFIQKLRTQGKILVNGQPQKAGYKLRSNDKITVDYDMSKLAQTPEIDLAVLYEDDDCVVINKPAGVLTHSKGSFNPEATVATWLQEYLLDHNAKFTSTVPVNNREGIAHRLDRGTSGVMICAKTPEALSWLQKQFSQRRVKKTYIAVVKGIPEPQKAVIDMPIERHPAHPQTFRVGAKGKPATTTYEVIKTDGDHSLLQLTPQTGRTHQLRVHLAKLGFPIVGDSLYGGESAPRLYLHALKLELTLPSKERRIFEATLPSDFATYVK